MKTLKLLLATILISGFCSSSYAQVFGIRGGLNLSNLSEKDNDNRYDESNKNKIGFHIGGTVDFPISDIFSVETGLILTTKGMKYEESIGNMFATYDVKSKMTLYYLDIPITAKFAFDLGGSKLFVLAGPYIGVGLFGNAKSEVTINGRTESSNDAVEWGSDGLNRLDYGLTLGAGVQFNALLVGLYYNYGLANISSYSDNGYRANNRVLNISLGYRFNQ